MQESQDIESQLMKIDFSPIASYGPFVLRSDYIKKMADMSSTIMLQDNIIERLQRQLRQTEARLEVLLLNKERHSHEKKDQ